MKILFVNAHLISPDVDYQNAAVLINGKTVEQVFLPGQELPSDCRKIDLAGKILAPGFIDIHSHGRGNADFCDGTDQAYETIGKGKLADGVTSFLATTLTVSSDDIVRTCSCAAHYKSVNSDGSRLLGIHLEGPFIAPAGAGAQNPAFLKNPDIGLVREWNGICPVKKVSFSPELPGSEKFTRDLCDMGIMPSGAHSLAEYDTFEIMRNAGMKHLTHFCNVLTPLNHLKFGFVGGGLRSGDVYVEIITDGVHLCDEMIDLICRLKGPERIMVISDAMRAAGMPDGNYSLGGLPVTVRNGRATLDNGRVAGSTMLYYKGIQRLLRASGLRPCEAIKAAGYNQAVSLNLGKVGKIQREYDADMVVLDPEWNPLQTWVLGECRWSKA